MPEPIDTIRHVNSDEPMDEAELRQAAGTLDRFWRAGKTDVVQARIRVNARLAQIGAAPVPSIRDGLSRARVLHHRMNKGPVLSREELIAGREDLAPHLQEGRYGPIEHAASRIEAHIAARDGGQLIVEPARPKVDKQTIWGGIAILAVLAAILVSCVAIVSKGHDSSSDSRRQVAAFNACKHAVEDQLKAPSSADFQSVFTADYSFTSTAVTVSAYVDAENSFGAKIRNNWTCEADVNSDGDVSGVQVLSLTGR